MSLYRQGQYILIILHNANTETEAKLLEEFQNLLKI